MFEHLVLFKFNANATEEKQQELVNEALKLKSLIPGIVDISAGLNVTEETDKIQGYTLGLRATFEDRESLRNYASHPAHEQFVQLLGGLLENVIVVDYPKL